MLCTGTVVQRQDNVNNRTSADPPFPADSILAAGTTMEGLSVLKDKPDPVALEDDEYPAWLWTLLDAPASGGKEGEFDFVAERRRLRAQ